MSDMIHSVRLIPETYSPTDNTKLTLLVQRAFNDALPGQWEFAGGKRDKGEDLLSALRREFREETGMSIVDNPSFVTTLHFTLPNGRPLQQDVFRGLVDGELVLSHEHEQGRFFTDEEIRNLQLPLTEGTAHVLGKHL